MLTARSSLAAAAVALTLAPALRDRVLGGRVVAEFDNPLTRTLVGLYRPFDPSDDPNNPEVNHIQLIPSGGALSLAQATSTFSRDPRCR